MGWNQIQTQHILGCYVTYVLMLCFVLRLREGSASFEIANPRAVGRAEEVCLVLSKLKSESWVKELEDAGLVREIESPYAAPVVVAPKKDESGQWTDLRYAIDYRRLNSVTVRDQYPAPVPEEILAKMEGAKLFTIMDAQKALGCGS